MNHCSTHREFDDCCPGCLRITLAATTGEVARLRGVLVELATDAALIVYMWTADDKVTPLRAWCQACAHGYEAPSLPADLFCTNSKCTAAKAGRRLRALAPDRLPTREEGEETVKRLGIDVPKWAAEIRAKVAAAATPIPPVPAGAPAPLTVLEWDAEPGAAARHGEPVFAASLELARGTLPKGLVRSEPIGHAGEAKDLVETWEAAT